jgi:O-antigen ligase
MDTVRMIGVDTSYNDPNTFSATVLYGLPIVYPLWFVATKWWHRRALAGYVCLSITCILLTGSRTSFFGLCLLSVLAVALSKHRVRLAVLFAVAAPLVWISLRVDLQNRFLTLIDPSYGPANAQASAEGRTIGWRAGVRLWRENPVFGIGPGAFGIATGTGMESHHLYGQVVGELGTAGAIAFALVVLAFVANALECRRHCRAEPSLKGTFDARLISAVTVTVALLLALGFGGHNLYRYTWLWYGVFQAIALHCLRLREVEVPEPGTLVDLSPMEPACF